MIISWFVFVDVLRFQFLSFFSEVFVEQHWHVVRFDFSTRNFCAGDFMKGSTAFCIDFCFRFFQLIVQLTNFVPARGHIIRFTPLTRWRPLQGARSPASKHITTSFAFAEIPTTGNPNLWTITPTIADVQHARRVFLVIPGARKSRRDLFQFYSTLLAQHPCK